MLLDDCTEVIYGDGFNLLISHPGVCFSTAWVKRTTVFKGLPTIVELEARNFL